MIRCRYQELDLAECHAVATAVCHCAGTLPADWAPTLRNRWFADSVQEEEGFEFLVHLQRGQPCAKLASPFFRAQLHRLPSFFISENDDFKLPASQVFLLVPRREETREGLRPFGCRSHGETRLSGHLVDLI